MILNFVNFLFLILNRFFFNLQNIVREFAKRGANVVVTGRNTEVVARIAEECTSLSPNGAEALGHVADVTNKDSLAGLVQAAIDKVLYSQKNPNSIYERPT